MTILKSKFRFVEATDWQVEDDMYELIDNPDIHIQCHDTGGYGVRVWNEAEGAMTFGKEFDDLDSAMYEALTVVETPQRLVSKQNEALRLLKHSLED